MISPCFTSPAGIAFLTAQMITSPTLAMRRLNMPLLLEPRSTLMHIACLAPVLSAMSRYVCCWIMAVVRCQSQVLARRFSQFVCPSRGPATDNGPRTTDPLPFLRRLAGHHFFRRHLHGALRGALDHPQQAVVLGLADRAALGDLDG